METKQITTEQIEKVKELVGDFRKDKEQYIYCGTMLNSDYCHLLGIDYTTIHLLGEVSYNLVYVETEDKDYQLYCETYIDNVMNDRLSFILEDIAKDSEDYLGLFAEKVEIGVARWLPNNWKELITDEQLHDILQERNIQTIECLQDNDVPDEMKERIAYAYMDENSCTCADYCYSQMGSCEQKDFIKECIDNL